MLNFADIECIAPGIDGLSQHELNAALSFTLMWTIFEAQVLGANASVRKINEVIKALDSVVLNKIQYREALHYFRDRYVENSDTNYRFEHLHLRNNDNPELVKLVLTGQIEEPWQELVVCLTIVYRFRNNFFHGLKWAYGLRNQLDNFQQSINLLTACLEWFPRTNNE